MAKTSQLLVFLALIAAAVSGCHNPRAHLAESSEEPVSAALTNRSTLAHEILRRELNDAGEVAQHLAMLDRVLAEILSQLNSLPPGKSERERAKKFFSTVDTVLIRQNFVYPPRSLVSFLSEALTPAQLSSAEGELALSKEANWRRGLEIKQAVREHGDVFVSDCDTTALIYLAAAELMGYPCSMVEIPGHNFLRWTSPSLAFNWDPNMGQSYSDDKYTREAGLTAKTNDCLPYLKSMSRAETLGYWMAIIGRERTKQKRYAEAARAFEDACRLAPRSLYAAHERAWFLATCADPAFRDGRAAIPIITRTVECWPDPNFMDTLAIAHAETQDFERAVEIERRALEQSKVWQRSKYAMNPWPSFQQLIAIFSRGETYAEFVARTTTAPAIAPQL